MCGIVGYIGPSGAVDIVLEGLSRLEYRGYDSAGICILNQNRELVPHKKVGKLDVLKDYLRGKDLAAHVCIGHTRWATHGGVTDVNAHPHTNKFTSLVHNGIIENASSLKRFLQKEGMSFLSETDSEVFSVIIHRNMLKGLSFFDAVREGFKLLEGNSAFVIMGRDGDEILALRRAAPLVCGMNKKNGELFVSSDPYALAGFTDNLIFPEDEVLVSLKRKDGVVSMEFFELDGHPSTRYHMRPQGMNFLAVEKGIYQHFMQKEIHEQPDLIRALLPYYLAGDGRAKIEAVKALNPKRLHIIACGTAWHAGLAIRNLIEQYTKLPITVELASEFRYRNPLLLPGDVGIFISQSGETADTLAAQVLCKSKGIKTVSILNVEGSSLYRNCDINLPIHAGVEIGVASTKAFTQQVLTGYFLCKALSGGLDDPQVRLEVVELADKIDELLRVAASVEQIAAENFHQRGFLFTGRGKYFPIAQEGALKLKEIAYVHAEGYAAGELKHGPIALIDEDMVNVAIIGPELFDKTVSNIEEVKARKGVIVVIGPEHEHLRKLANYYVPLKMKDQADLNPLYANVVCQLFSYYVARFRGTDIDKPRNLAKSVTVE